MAYPASETRNSSGVRLAGIIGIVVLAIIVALVFWFRSENGPNLAWMAWTTQTMTFFLVIVGLLLSMCIWEVFSPGGSPRVGLLRFETTRGDRLFLSLLGSAFIHLAWLAFVGPDLWKALGVSVFYAVLVFIFV